MVGLKVYADRMSQPSRAVILFCMLNRIEFEEIKVDLIKRQQLSPEYKVMQFSFYLACAFPGVADHWYPADLTKRAKLHSVLDWHHSNLRRGSVTFIINTTLGAALGIPMNPQAPAKAEKLLSSSLSKIESFLAQRQQEVLVRQLAAIDSRSQPCM